MFVFRFARFGRLAAGDAHTTVHEAIHWLALLPMALLLASIDVCALAVVRLALGFCRRHHALFTKFVALFPFLASTQERLALGERGSRGLGEEPLHHEGELCGDPRVIGAAIGALVHLGVFDPFSLFDVYFMTIILPVIKR